MTFASKRFENQLKRFRALIFALSIIPFSIVAHGQQNSTTDKTQSAKPVQSPSQSSSQRRIQAVRITEALKIDGLLDEAVWSSAQPATDFLEQQPTEGGKAELVSLRERSSSPFDSNECSGAESLTQGNPESDEGMCI
jgi:hypothetical protein